MKNKRIITTPLKVMIGLLLVLILFLGLQLWHPWQRQSAVFYEPLMLPVEAIKGDTIVLSNSGCITIEHNEKINSITHNGDYISINATRHVTLWELITGQ